MQIGKAVGLATAQLQTAKQGVSNVTRDKQRVECYQLLTSSCLLV